MANRITTVVVDSRDPVGLAEFWGQVLGYAVLDDPGCADELDGSVEIGPPGQPAKGPVPTLLFLPVPDPTPGKVRLHLDLNATDRDQDAELGRLLALGATRADVGQTDEQSWYVLADPEGTSSASCGPASSRSEPAQRRPGTAPGRSGPVTGPGRSLTGTRAAAQLPWGTAPGGVVVR